MRKESGNRGDMTSRVEALVGGVGGFFSELGQRDNDRYLSWEHCYGAFDQERKWENPNIEKLCLHLAFYLASWGMYRGSSFLLQKDYLIHRKPVELLLDKRYEKLWGISASELCRKENRDLVFELNKHLAEYYKGVRQEVCRESNKREPIMEISQTLITKMLMGTMGCCPAFDRYFVLGLKEFNLRQTFSPDTLRAIAEFYVKYERLFDQLKRRIQKGQLEYPQMKIIDLAFWKFEFDVESTEASLKKAVMQGDEIEAERLRWKLRRLTEGVREVKQ